MDLLLFRTGAVVAAWMSVLVCGGVAARCRTVLLVPQRQGRGGRWALLRAELLESRKGAAS